MQSLVISETGGTCVWQGLPGACFWLTLRCFVSIFTDISRVFNEAKRIYIVLMSLEKIDKNLGGQLEILTSIHVSNFFVRSFFFFK